jgi:hypothetical protein
MVNPQDVKLFVATPVFGGCTHNYVQGMFDLGFGCRHFGIETKYQQTVNQPYIHLARNRLAAIFLETNFTHFMFIDQDVGFIGQDIFSLIQQDKDVVAGTYPLKQIDWKNVAQAVHDGVPPEKLEEMSAVHIFKPIDLDKKFNSKELVEVEHVGTGFMLIKRQVFEKLAQIVGRYFEVFGPENRKETLDFFGHSVLNNEFWGEDVSFCKRVRDAGMKVFVAPWVQCSHFGSYHYNAQTQE